VRSHQREGGLIVIERRGLPRGHRMACQTIVGELTLHVIRVGRLREIGLMAGVTIC
jgi:hypothetical protein